MKLIDLDAKQGYLLDEKYKVRAGSDYLPVSKQIKKLLQEIARKKQGNEYREIIVKEYHNEKGLLTRREVGEELVRCKDCKKRNTRTCMMNNNVGMNKDLFDDDYCSYGKPKEQEHE